MKKIIIGGVPSPIGGVTTYLRRLFHRDCANIDLFLDFYPSAKEPLHVACQSKLVELDGKLGLLKWMWRNRAAQVGHEIFFNFSTPRALFLTLLFPKFRAVRWTIMLHHGDLKIKNHLSYWIARLALKRFDTVKSLSQKQSEFYRSVNVLTNHIEQTSSYCQPADHSDAPEAKVDLANLRTQYDKIVIMSGFPTQLYNFERGIEALATDNTENCALCIFIYGPGDLRSRLHELANAYDWLFVFDGKNERFFNTFLRYSDLLMRLTDTDSCGISVWDAEHWNRAIIASNVCERPISANNIKLNETTKEQLATLVQHTVAATTHS